MENFVPYQVYVGEALAVATIAVVLLLQWLLSLLDAYTKKRRHLQQLANAAYRETALLGLTAFILFVVEIAVNVSDTVIHQLEIMHICVWVIAILYILWVFVLVVFSVRIRKRWAHWESIYLHSSEAYLKVKAQLATEFTEMKHITDSASAISGSTSFSFMIAVIRHPLKAFSYFKTLHIVRYIELRTRFVKKFGLGADFPFWLYLNECKQHVFLKLAELPVLLWGSVIYAVSLDLYLRSIWLWYSNTVQGAVIVVMMAIGCIIASFMVWIKMRAISWQILHKEYNIGDNSPGGSPTAIPEIDESTIRDLASFQHPPVHEIRRVISATAGASRQRFVEDRKLFWFGLPVLLIRMLQGVLFGETAAVALFVISFSEITSDLASTLWAVLSIIASTVISLMFLSVVVPSYVLTIHVSDLVEAGLLAQAIVRNEKYRRAKEIERIDKAFSRHRMVRPSPVSTSRLQRLFNTVMVSRQTQIVVSFAILLDFFFIALTTSSYINQTGRIILNAFDILLVAIVVCELALRIYSTGIKTYFSTADRSTLCWNIIDVVVVCAATAATAVSVVYVFNGDGNNNAGAALYIAPLLALRLLRSGLIVQLLREEPPQPAPSQADKLPEEGGPSIGHFISLRDYTGSRTASRRHYTRPAIPQAWDGTKQPAAAVMENLQESKAAPEGQPRNTEADHPVPMTSPTQIASMPSSRITAAFMFPHHESKSSEGKDESPVVISVLPSVPEDAPLP